MSISPTFYEQLFRSQVRKAQKRQSRQHLFALLGCIKAERKHVDEIDHRFKAGKDKSKGMLKNFKPVTNNVSTSDRKAS